MHLDMQHIIGCCSCLPMASLPCIDKLDQMVGFRAFGCVDTGPLHMPDSCTVSDDELSQDVFDHDFSVLLCRGLGGF